MKDVKDILNEAQEKMDMAIMYLDEALAHIRAGKADVRLLDGIRVDSYGSMVPINNVAAVTTPDLTGHHARKQRRNHPYWHSASDRRAS